MNLKKPLYATNYGAAYIGNSLELLDCLESDSIDLVMTSPPFALLREKSYGNVEQEAYIDWLFAFCRKVHRVLSPQGSFVIDLGGAYQSKRPVRSLYNYRILIKLCDELDFRLAEEFFWHNPSKLPSPIEWVNKRKLRAKDSVNTVWWLSKTDYPKANVSNVLVPYSERMKKLHENPEKYYKPKARPSGHDIGSGFATNNGGAIPSNLLQIPNSESNSRYIQLCKAVGIAAHPARFPQKLPRFFINFLTDPGDTVLDIFAGSNTTGAAAEALRRRWIAFEQNPSYLAASAFRFLEDNQSIEAASALFKKLVAKPEISNIS
ncbi:site-specific DNA-methyltransferase [Coleofasciculus sp. FACHB-64]|uniref:DNA-methyltransferase n=1 Tax=Cyanophyceae TaxID=3028117 RepID=UPI00168968CA|nr:site-specific DNA-methyltransferase [Coleofasciculus sp. FACHB-64]MBD1840553.1 site-specific DNA-methyltransferase [Coleofasciculus sp. FACHB-501]MBD2045134.1 site-specific DNA-methyltransferase [Coleofasciculus sp. FACHB-64]